MLNCKKKGFDSPVYSERDLQAYLISERKSSKRCTYNYCKAIVFDYLELLKNKSYGKHHYICVESLIESLHNQFNMNEDRFLNPELFIEETRVSKGR